MPLAFSGQKHALTQSHLSPNWNGVASLFTI
jgi:hypothetical protein